MKSTSKTKEQLLKELDSLRKQLAVMEKTAAERKRVEEQLRMREQIFDRTMQIIETTFNPVFIHSEKGWCVYVNETAAKTYGYTKEELMKINLRKLEVPDSAEPFETRMKKALAEGMSTYDVDHYHKDGSIMSLVMYTRGVILDGNPLFVSGAYNVTERKRNEEALREREARYRYLFEHSQVANALVGLDGKFIDANEAAAKLYGYEKSEIIGKAMLEFVAPESLAKVAEAFSAGLAGTPPGPMEVGITTKKGARTFLFPGGYHMLFEGGKQKGFLISAFDITERKQLEDAVKKSEERYRTIMDEMDDGYFELDLAGNFTFVNDANCRQLGYSQGELVGMNYRAITYSEDVERIYKIFNQVYKEGRPIRDFTMKTVHKDGSHGLGELSVFPVRNEKGETIGFRGVGRDIVERMKMLESLRQSEERYRTVLDEMDDTYYELDLAGHLTFFNDALIRKSGISREELIGMPFRDYIPEKDRELVFKAFNQVYKTGKSLKGLRLEAKRKGGPSLMSEESILPLRDKDGEIIGFRGISHDVTQHLEMMEALRQSEERYRTMLDEMEEAYYETDLTGKFTFFSDALCRQLGYTREEIMGLSYKTYVPRENAKKVFETYNRVYRTGEPVESFASSQIRKDGTLVLTEDSIFPMRNEKGEVIGFRGISRDVTERRRVEEERKQLEQKAQFASRLASVGELASGVAHEINNPLTAVIGYAHLLLEGKNVPDDIRRDVEVINEGAQRVAGIIKKLLVFARQSKPERTYVDINEIINTTLELRAYSLQANNVKVILQFDPDLPLTVADPGQLQQVFLNLIVNAETEVKLAHGGGRLAIKTEQVGDNVRVSFKDNGLGIAKENIDRIFDPFFTTRKVGQGTGLGLSVCHGIITEHKGRIWVESQLGRGATFIVELPVVAEDKQLEFPEPVIKEPSNVSGAKILVVDDEAVIRQFVNQTLIDAGHEVALVDSAESALEEVKNKDYQVILLDIKMHGMNGIELYGHFQKTSPSLAERVIFITGDVMGPNTMDFLSKTKVPYIIKPFDAKQLKTEINRVLARG